MIDLLEAGKVAAQLAAPCVTAFFGYLINKRLKQQEQNTWNNRRIIEKRLQIYDKIAPELNTVYCFCAWLGDWKDISPEQVIKSKRTCDKTMHVYRYLFDQDVFSAYDNFIHSVFQTYNGPGEDAKIRTPVSHTKHGDRTKDARYRWNEDWRPLFLPDQACTQEALLRAYTELMMSFRDNLGLSDDTRKKMS